MPRRERAAAAAAAAKLLKNQHAQPDGRNEQMTAQEGNEPHPRPIINNSPRQILKRGAAAAAAAARLPFLNLRKNKKKNSIKGSKSRRQLFEVDHPPDDWDRITRTITKLRVPQPATYVDDLSFDVFHCPDEPPSGYPFEWNLVDHVLKDWNPDVTDIPTKIHHGLCVFDWNDPQARQRAETYQSLELPFVLQNHPEILRASERWNHPMYLHNLIGREPQRNEYSKVCRSRDYCGETCQRASWLCLHCISLSPFSTTFDLEQSFHVLADTAFKNSCRQLDTAYRKCGAPL